MIGSMTKAISIRQARLQHQEAMRDLANGELIPKAMAEALGNAVSDLLKFEDEGWTLLNKLDYTNTKGISLAEVKDVTGYLEQQVKVSGGLLGRGLRLKNNHFSGRGFAFRREDGGEIKPRFRKIINDPVNQQEVFSATAIKELNRILYTSGNLFIVYNQEHGEFSRMSVDQSIEEVLVDPASPGRIRYVLRCMNVVDDLSGTRSVAREWIPTVTHRDSMRKRKTPLPNSLPLPGADGERAFVRHDSVVIERRVNKDNGDIWGLPDSFSAAPWAMMYSTYLRDGAKLQNALAAISYVVRVKTEAAAKAAGSQISTGRVGGAAVTGPGTEIESMPRAGAIDLYEGRPIQAQVASNLDVSTTAIASDPGPGGSYASESALSQPEQLAALSRQEDFADLYRQIFMAIGADDIVIDFARLDTDPIHRTMQGLTLAREKGAINQRQYRERAMELYDIPGDIDQLPEPDAWTGSKASTLVDAAPMDDPDISVSSAPGQGVSGDVGALDDDGNDARNSDRDAGEA